MRTRWEVGLLGSFLVGCSSSSELDPSGDTTAESPTRCRDYETPWDGVETDCDPTNEYDFDGDGYVVDRVWVDGHWEDGLTLARAWVDAHENTFPSPFPASAQLKGGDCDDLDPAIHPGAADDPPYDGVDTDCDGANDFDLDGDGWVQEAHAAELQNYIVGFLDGMAPFEVRVGDCDDTAAHIHPDALDVPYDGLDADCDGSNDFDVDGDGWIAAGQSDAWREHIAGGGANGHVVAGLADCDDDNDFVNPGLPERPSLPRDIDCDGDALRPRLVLLDGRVRGSGVQLVQSDFYEAVLSADGTGLWGAVLPVAPDPRGHVDWVSLTNAEVRAFGGRATWTGLTLPFVTETRSGHVALDVGLWSAGTGPVGVTTWVDEAPLDIGGDETVFGSAEADFACGPAGLRFFDPSRPPIPASDPLCGVLDGHPVVCGDTCVLWEDGVTPIELPWSDPDQLTGGHAVVDGAVLAPDGSEVFAVPGAEDVAVDGSLAAWVVDGAVFVASPSGVAGPLHLERPDWIRHRESPELLSFRAEEVELGSYWGFVSIYVTGRRVGPDGQLGPLRLALARIDP